MSYTNIAQHKKKLKTSSYAATAGPKKDVSPPPIAKDTVKHGESLPRGSAPNPASPSGLTGNQRFKGGMQKIEAQIDSLDVKKKTKHLMKMGYEQKQAQRLAEAVVVNRRNKINEKKQKRKE